MGKLKHTITFSEFFTEGQYETEVEMLAVSSGKKSLTIAVPKETILFENRVALVPQSIRTLVGYGHKVLVEAGAGDKSNFTDHDYAEAGAEICIDKATLYKSEIVLKIAPPTDEEIHMMQQEQILISPIQLPVLQDDFLAKLSQKRITGLAMEYLQSEDGAYPIVRIMSEIAGYCAMMTAAEYLANDKNDGRGLLLGGIAGVPPAKVVILGAGVVAESAIRLAHGLGASIRVFDNDVMKLMRLQKSLGFQLHTSTINPVYLAYQLTSADVLIGALHSKKGRTPIVVTEEMVTKMKKNAVIIDVSIDQGGCIETSKMTTLANPFYKKHDVIHYCVPNIASKVSRTSSVAISNILTTILLKMGVYTNMEDALYHLHGLRNGCYTYKGSITHQYLSQRFGLKYTSIELLLTSKF